MDLLWSGKLLYEAPLGRFDQYKPLIYVIVPVSIVLVGVFADELLAPRALGGALLTALLVRLVGSSTGVRGPRG